MSDMKKSTCLLQVKRNSDNIARFYGSDWEYERDGSFYIWEDGNYSCDCNRRSFFLRAADEEEPEENACGDGAFSVRLFDAQTGELVYQDGEPASWEGITQPT